MNAAINQGPTVNLSEPVQAQPGPAGMTFHLIEPGSTTRFRPADTLGRIHAEARRLASLVPAQSPVGLLFRSGRDLIECWFACIHAGLRPLIMQYPTRKQSRAYWADSVTHTIVTANLAAILADDYCAGLGLPEGPRLLRRQDLKGPDAPDPGPLLPEDFSILQLSSGTTGYRKAMEFTAPALRRHAADFNCVLKLDPARDRIVSWLPLYHDMGYVACFVMPILLGIDVAMMDPVTWVENPDLLFEAAAAHNGTICYMPNFGFEVMLRAKARPLPSMRHWISCSEPVSPTTAAKFCAHIGADPATFAPCYAMAENLFAVTFGHGFETRPIDGTEVISCGRPIPEVSIKTVDGEIWVRSPYSLSRYLGGDDIRDADGYYPTGDLGTLRDGELYVSGRKGDVLNQAGRKFMLSDIDLKLNEAFPDIRGRAATLAVHDDRLGTETPLILIESQDFHDRKDAADIAVTMTDLTGMDQVEVVFVPPRFLTKTSSGKINRRKTRDDWLAVLAARARTAGPLDVAQHLRASFPHIGWTRPMRQVLDSLSTTIVRIALEATPVAYDGDLSLDALAARLDAAKVPASASAAAEGIRIVSLADRGVVAGISPADLARMGEALGCPVTIEHVCLPPSPVLLSDLIFHDWFQPRLDQEPFANVDLAMEQIKGASLLITDTIAELQFLYSSTYPVLSHALERDKRADLICVRWPNYAARHHLLPITLASGNDIPLTASNDSLDRMQRYLGTPIFRIVSVPGYESLCADWDYQAEGKMRRAAGDRTVLVNALTDWIRQHKEIRRRKVRADRPVAMSDLPHFCAVLARRSSVDAVLDHFNSFYICGTHASLPYVRHRLDELGKPYVVLPSISAETIAALPEKYECLIGAGAFGSPPRTMASAMFQTAGLGWRSRGLEPLGEDAGTVRWLNDYAPGGTDWYHCFPLGNQAAQRKLWHQAQKKQELASVSAN
jgi:acyl-CoA synthetase (AMP-forming)/AMP-acid ligase II